MQTDKKTRSYFERESGDFDASYSSPRQLTDIVRRLTYGISKRWIEGRLNALLDLVGNDVKGSSVLEVGCGPGFYSIRLAQKGSDVTAIDYSKGMIESAKKNSERLGANIKFLLGDFMDTFFSDKFDYVFATGVFDYIEKSKQREFLQKMSDLSNKYVIVSFPKKYSFHAFIRIIWLSFLKKVKTFYFTDKTIKTLASSCGLKETDRRDVGILWVIKFIKA